MARVTKIPYPKDAKTLDEQIALLRSRGVVINDEKKAKEYLLDIGYYRLGFYSFPFELTYPEKGRLRRHEIKPGSTIEDFVALYYFDFDLRSILNKYLSRIEVSIRTTMIYYLSLKYKADTTWFVSPSVVSADFINNFDAKVYAHIKTKPTIVSHANRYVGKYAPAWKTMEFMTMGNLEALYGALLLDADKRLISTAYNETSLSSFQNYLSVVREVRNACAHGNVIFDMHLVNSIMTGAACPSLTVDESFSLKGALRVILFLLEKVSVNRSRDMSRELRQAAIRLYSKVPAIRQLVEEKTGIVMGNPVCVYLKTIFMKMSNIF